jgi:hypothetical protein
MIPVVNRVTDKKITNKINLTRKLFMTFPSWLLRLSNWVGWKSGKVMETPLNKEKGETALNKFGHLLT